MKTVFQRFIHRLEDEYVNWFSWIPVGLGLGIALCFSFDLFIFVPLFLMCLGIIGLIYCRSGVRFFLWGFICVGLGFSTAFYRTETSSLVLLKKPERHRIIEGHVQDVSSHPRQNGSCRIIISQLRLTASPSICRRIQLGDVVTLEADLLPFSYPVTPNSFNWRRHYFFKNIKATGRVRKVLNFHRQKPNFLVHLRYKIGKYIEHHLPAQEGAIAKALIIGDTSGISQNVRQKFSDSGLAHILAISGLHMSLVTGMMFLVIRRSLSCIPFVALRYPIKLWSLCGAVVASFCYLLISGMGFPALRSFSMGVFVMIGFMLNRHPISLRSLSIAAALILLFYPEALLSISFQLSFAAVTALITGYTCFKIQNRLGHYLASLMFSTCLATLATFPFTIETFQRVTLQAITGNLVAIPLTTFWIMPSALLSLVSPLFFPLWQKGVYCLICIADYVAQLPGAAITFSRPPLFFLPLISFGGLWLCLWQTRWRFWGIGVIAASIGLWWLCPVKVPDIMLSSSTLAYYKQDTLYVPNLHKGKFDYENWMREWNIKKVKPWDQRLITWKGYTLVPDPWKLKDKNISYARMITNGKIPDALLDRRYLKSNCFIKDHQISCVKISKRKWD